MLMLTLNHSEFFSANVKKMLVKPSLCQEYNLELKLEKIKLQNLSSKFYYNSFQYININSIISKVFNYGLH